VLRTIRVGAVLVHLGSSDFLSRYKNLRRTCRPGAAVRQTGVGGPALEHQIIVNPDSRMRPRRPNDAGGGQGRDGSGE